MQAVVKSLQAAERLTASLDVSQFDVQVCN